MKTVLKCLFLFCLACLIISCTPTTRPPSISEGEAEAEAHKQRQVAYRTLRERHNRLNDVSWRVKAGNADLCDKTTYSAGVWFSSLERTPRQYKQIARTEYGIGEYLTAIHVVDGSPADEAGLKKGHYITAWYGENLGTGKKAEKALLNLNKNRDGSSEIVTVLDGGRQHSINIRPVPVCDYPVVMIEGPQRNAFADGKRVVITTGMLGFLHSDEELALIIGHELAHNTMNHMEAALGNRLIGATIGALIGAAVGVDMAQLGADIGEIAFSEEFEAEADYVGVYYAARAGFDISNAAAIWRRMATENPEAIDIQDSTHPSTSKRFLSVERAVEEFERKRANGLSLIPEEKDG